MSLSETTHDVEVVSDLLVGADSIEDRTVVAVLNAVEPDRIHTCVHVVYSTPPSRTVSSRGRSESSGSRTFQTCIFCSTS